MNRQLQVFLLAVIAAVIAFRHVERHAPAPSMQNNFLDPSTISYLGHAIKLSRSYDTFEDYKDDPNNIDPSQIALVQKLVAEAPVAADYPDRNAVIHAEIFDLTFPGYGSGSFGDQGPGSDLYLTEIEIPQSERGRYLTFRIRNDRYILVDDFIAPEIPMIEKVREESGKLTYYTGDGKVAATHTAK